MEMLGMAATVMVLGHLALGVILWLRVRKLYSYPGLLGFPVIGNLYYFYRTLFLVNIEDIRAYYVQVAKQYGKNGLCFLYMCAFRNMVLVTSPHVIKQLGCHPHLKDKPPSVFTPILKYCNGPFSRPYSDDSWKMKRKEYNCMLRKASVETNFYDIFLKSADKLVELMLASSSALDTHKAVLGVVQIVTMEGLLGVDSGLALDPEIIHFMHQLPDFISLMVGNPGISGTVLRLLGPLDGLLIGPVRTCHKMISQSLKEIIEKLKSIKRFPSEGEDAETKHPLSFYIASRIVKDKYFLENLTTELEELLVTSSHTVASAMSFTITCLAVLPDLQERAWREQYDIFGDDRREPTLQDLEQMTFLERFIKESLRFSGPPYVGKQASKDIAVDGVIIPKDTIVVYMLNLMSKDPQYWREPEVFNPDRFLEENPGLNYSYAPFGIGIRNCPGMNFAKMQMKITLSKVLRRLMLSPLKKNLKFEDLQFEAHLLMGLKNPPLLQVKERI